MKQIFLSIVAILLSVHLYAGDSYTSVKTVCSSILGGVVRHNNALQSNAQKAEVALLELARFQDFQLLKPANLSPDDIEPDINEVATTSLGGDVSKAEVASRIEGILRYDNGLPLNMRELLEGGSEQRKIFALELVGREEIQSFLAGVMKDITRTRKYMDHLQFTNLTRYQALLDINPQYMFQLLDPVGKPSALQVEYFFYAYLLPRWFSEHDTFALKEKGKSTRLTSEQRNKGIESARKKAQKLREKFQELEGFNFQDFAAKFSNDPNVYAFLMYLLNNSVLKAKYPRVHPNVLGSEFDIAWSRSLYNKLYGEEVSSYHSMATTGVFFDYLVTAGLFSLGAFHLATVPPGDMFTLPAVFSILTPFVAAVANGFYKPLGRVFHRLIRDSESAQASRSLVDFVSNEMENPQLQPGQWMYYGANLTLTWESIRTNILPDRLGQRFYATNEDLLDHQPILAKLAQRISDFFKSRAVSEQEKKDQQAYWTGFDLFYENAVVSNEPSVPSVPKLVVVIRTSVVNPKFGKPRRAKKEVMEPQRVNIPGWSPELVPVTVPVKQN